ncbi:MAG TPA: vitamin K epoxide reductase family protein [Bacteroidota bacterium]|nr:vitamin K epoxide reductase family protein [Bacteroidota bacterium]
MLIPCFLILCAVMGFLISLYFLLVYFNIMRANQSFIPSLCRMDEHTCEYVLHTSYAKLLGIPNSALGVIFYIVIFFAVFIDGIRTNVFTNRLIILSSISTVVASIYLAYVLIVKVKARCILCFTIHILNVIILILLTYTNG